MPALTPELKSKFELAIESLKNKILQANIHKPDVNMPDEHGRTLLHYASAIGDTKYVEELLRQGAEINLKDNKESGFTPIEVASMFEQGDVVALLVGRKADLRLHVLNQFMSNSMRLQIYKHVHDELLLRAKDQFANGNDLLKFLNKAASIDAIDLFKVIESSNDSWLKTLLDYVMKNYSNEILLNASTNNAVAVCGYLLFDLKASMEPLIKSDSCPPHIAISKGYWEFVQTYIDNNYDINTRDNNGNSLLQSAINGKNRRCILNIIDKGINLNLENDTEEIFLHNLFKSGLSSELIKEVLQRIERETLLVLMTKQDMYGTTPFHLAGSNNYTDLLDEMNIKNIGALETTDNTRNFDISQSPLNKKMKLFLSYTSPQPDIPFSEPGYCMGYSILVSVLGEKRFDAILGCFSRWDGSKDALNNPLPDGPLRGLNFRNIGEMFREFIYCISWAQQTWIAFGAEIDFVKILNTFNVPFTVYSEFAIDTSKQINVLKFIEAFKECPVNTRVLLVGDGHACSMRITDNKLIAYRDPNHEKLLPEYSDSNKLAKVLANTKFKSSGSWSNTSFVVFRCGADHQLHNKAEVTDHFSTHASIFNPSDRFSKSKFILMSGKKETSHQYPEEKIYSDRPPNLLRFFTDEELHNLSPTINK